ncbi:MAG: recombination mediator RecR [Candidatus Omnitrophota bacterium]|nr:recombination mediator RecR [Candidatus Omnitrophota bacterium]
MAGGLPRSMTDLIQEFSKMPGIGSHSAKKLAFYILQTENEEVKKLLSNIRTVKENIRFCGVCNNLSENDMCEICADRKRDRSRICVVSGPSGIMAMEKSGVHNGLYHVLLGELSPIDGIGPDDLKIKELLVRIKNEPVKEIVIATDFTTEGETTALYLMGKLRSSGIKVSRLARGVPAGAALESADMATIQRAFEERK